jgi:hypothetical protein
MPAAVDSSCSIALCSPRLQTFPQALVTLRWWHRCQPLQASHGGALGVCTAGFEKQHFSRSGPGFSPLDRVLQPDLSLVLARPPIGPAAVLGRMAQVQRSTAIPLEASLAGVLDADHLARPGNVLYRSTAGALGGSPVGAVGKADDATGALTQSLSSLRRCGSLRKLAQDRILKPRARRQALSPHAVLQKPCHG